LDQCFQLSTFETYQYNFNYFRNIFDLKSESFYESEKRKMFVSTLGRTMEKTEAIPAAVGYIAGAG
jgi:hypothetical protein